jgi:hypothetical protein
LHEAPLKHGEEAHSEMSASQRRPVKPGRHSHVKLRGMSIHESEPKGLHGLL